jgi:hypothetical protein
MKKLLILILLLAPAGYLLAQDTNRTAKAIRTTLPVKIDGTLNDPAWNTATAFTDFIEQRPVFGNRENEATKTEVWLLYDDNAIYVAGFCHEKNQDSISTELVGRDKIGINDFAGIMFDTYLDKINGAGFYVTALGEQYDAKYSLGNEDDNWSTVYQTATKISAQGWTFEMRIPYAALRFSKAAVQNWGVNIIRKRTRAGKQYTWSPLNPNRFGTMNQAGILTGIENIKSPLRLSFSPYFSAYLNQAPTAGNAKNISTSLNGGMDVKYGVSKGFTLDMTLIPDFGQVQSDNQVLNLSPFEVRFNENRSFFTEGTELFNKGNFFYSRRVGGTPIHLGKPYQQAGVTDSVLKNPSETKLINATKFSGRTKGGLGIGIFNAITKPQYADMLNKGTNESYEIETSPWTNYNILVLDQTMKNNSSVSLVNTNVMRSGKDYDANVVAALYDIYDKKVDWNIWGKLANSQLIGIDQGKTVSGFMHEINLGKFRGPFNFEVHHHLADDKYQQNDLGYFTNNNYSNYAANAWYKVNKPNGFYNNLYFSLGGTYSELWKPSKFQYINIYSRANSQLKNLWQVGINSNINLEGQDFYESRLAGRVFKVPGNVSAGLSVGSNTAKKYSMTLQYNHLFSGKYEANTGELYLSNQYRFNDKLTVGISSYNSSAKNNVGFAFLNAARDTSFFGLRKRTTVENIVNLKYNFNIKMGITFRARHYWSRVDYKSFFTLQEDGYLKPVSDVEKNPETNVNFFNIDMVYTWQFAPGSFINVGWKNAGSIYNQQTIDPYHKNLGNILKAPQENNFSVKIIYFLDYLSLKKKG